VLITRYCSLIKCRNPRTLQNYSHKNIVATRFELFMVHIKSLLCERKMCLDKLISATEVATLLSYFKQLLMYCGRNCQQKHVSSYYAHTTHNLKSEMSYITKKRQQGKMK